MTAESAPRRLTFERSAVLALLVTTVFAIAAVMALREAPRPHPAMRAAYVLGLVALVLVLPLPSGSWRVWRDSARVGLAWLIVPLAMLGLFFPVAYFAIGAAVLAIVAPKWLALVLALLAGHLLVLRRAKDRRRELTARDLAAWRVGALVPLAAFVGAYSAPLFAAYQGLHFRRPSLESGVVALRRTHACVREWIATHGGEVPLDLETPGVADTRCRTDEVRGWRVLYAHDTARAGGFTLVAREKVLPLTTYRSVAADETGALHVADGRRDAGRDDPFLTNIPRELTAIRECIAEVVALRPGHELPVSLAELGPRGEACRILDGARWTADSGAIVTIHYYAGPTSAGEQYRFVYSLTTDSAGAPIPRVDARPVRYPEDGLRSYALIGDSVRASGDDRPAGPRDPLADRCEEFWPSGDCPRPEWMAWSHAIADVRAAPSAARGGGVLPARDSSIAWTAPLGDRPKDGIFAALGAPVVGVDSAVFAASPAGVYAFAAGGAHRWARTDLRVVDDGGLALIGEQLIAPTADSGLVALDPATGRTRWKSSAVPGMLAYSPVGLPGGAIGVANLAGTLSVFERDGRLRWTRRLGARIYSDPVADARGTIYALVDGRETELVMIGADGRERRRVRSGGWRTPPAPLADGTVLVASGAGLFAVEPKGGAPRKLAASAEDADRILVRPDGSMLFTDDERLIAMAGNGRRLWSWQPTGRPGGAPRGPAALPDGSIVLADASGLLGVSATGDSLWVVSYGNAGIPSTPAVGPDGTVYVADTRWRITAVRPPRR